MLREHDATTWQSDDIVITNRMHDITHIQEEWAYLQSQYGLATPDSDLDVYRKAIFGMGEECVPHIVIFYKAGKPCAGILGRINRERIVSGLGYAYVKSPRLKVLTVVYGGFLSDGSLDSYNAMLEYFQGLLKSRTVDALIFHHLSMDDEFANALIQNLCSKSNVVSRQNTRWILDLVDPRTNNRVSLNSSKTRSTFRRKDRKFVEHFGGAVKLKCYQSITDVDEFVHIASKVTTQTYQAALGVGVQDTEQCRAILTALAGGNNFRGYVLTGDKEPIAYIAGSVLQQKFTLFATSFLPAYRTLSPGTVLMNRCFTSLASDGITMFDFGSVSANYKRLHATRSLNEQTVHVYGVGWRSFTARNIEKTTLYLSKCLVKGASSLGMLDSMKRHWRHRLEKACSEQIFQNRNSSEY